ncbi:MAG: hypothetical protein AAF502_17170 [Bacteroidota bacterium]
MKTCAKCKLEYMPNRSDQKYCSSKCRWAVKNGRAGEVYHVTKRINKILKSNRQILERFFQESEDICTVKYGDLKNVGFMFEYLTHVRVRHNNPKGKTQKFCYDFGWERIDSVTVKILKS